MSMESDFTVLGIVGYNGVSFGPSVDETLVAEPVYDSGGRTIIYYVVHFHFEWYVDMTNNSQYPPDVEDSTTTTDRQLEVIRQQLMHNGADFQYAGSGFGYLDVNTADDSPEITHGPSLLDPIWGPKPRKLTFKTLGAKAAKCSYDIDAALLNCPDAAASGKLMEFCFKVAWDTEDGLTTRTYSAHWSIPATRGPDGDRTLPDNADKYLNDKTVPATPQGFRRKPIRRTLSEDKCRLDITVVDEQWPGRNYPPRSVVTVKARHSVSTNTSMIPWSGQFSGTYEYARGVSPALAYKEFLTWVKDRLDNVKTVTKKDAIPKELRLTEPDAYGRGMAEFQLNYFYTLGAKDVAKTALAASGLWRPVPGSDWDTWAKSMKDLKVWDPRGYAQLAFQDADDLIIDLCLQTTKPAIPKETPTDPVERFAPKLPLFVATPSNSFIDYKLELMISTSHATAELKPLPTKPVFYQGKKVSVDDADGYRPPYNSSNPSVIQFRNNPTVTLTLRGRALRAGYSITPPQITSVFGMTPAPAGRDFFSTSVAAQWMGVPIIKAAWQTSYILPDLPSPGNGFTAPLNPLLGGPPNAASLGYVVGK